MSQEAIALPECSSESPRVVRENVRQQLSSDIEAFLSKGGNVQNVDNNVRADPPKKPSMNYGSAPI
jgi:SutA RNAP-binding domain